MITKQGTGQGRAHLCGEYLKNLLHERIRDLEPYGPYWTRQTGSIGEHLLTLREQ